MGVSEERWFVTELVTELVTGPLRYSSCELLLLEAEARGQFRNPEEGKRPPLETATKQRQWRRDSGH
jgi:hypothetical protein